MALNNNLIEMLRNWGIYKFELFKTFQSDENRVLYFVNTDRGKYILKVFDEGLPLEYIERYTSVLSFLSDNEKKISPNLYRTLKNELYISYSNRYAYLMEFIEGEELRESVEDEYELGKAAAKLHLLEGCSYSSTINIYRSIFNMYSRFEGMPFKEEYDAVIDSLPDFNLYKKCFIHTDIAPRNAIKTESGEIIFIDFDDAGIGSLYLDLGFPLITQFVRFENCELGQIPVNTENIIFLYDKAKAFYEGYFSVTKPTEEEKELIFYGAAFMQLIYMISSDKDEINYMWAILKFAINKKDLLLTVIA